jgi:hypothetical protein
MCAGGCGGDARSPPVADRAHEVRLVAAGAGREVDALARVARVVDPALNAVVPTAPGRRFVLLDFRWRDTHGELPIEWLRFALLDDERRRWPESYRLPGRVLFHGRPDTPRILPVGFSVPADARPVTLVVSCIIPALMIRGRLPLPRR